jgi:phage shock protein PspC (stress-responsive transcriptional regulator)
MTIFTRPIHRARYDTQIGGVCAGIARWAGWHPNVVRVACILLTVFTGLAPGLIAYAVLWVYLAPEKDTAAAAGAA